MDRREFLKSVVLLSTVISLPMEVIAKASDQLIDELWEDVKNNPVNFYVRSRGALTTSPDDSEYPDTRAELLMYDPVKTVEDLEYLAFEEYRVSDMIWMAAEEAEKKYSSWEEYLIEADGDAISGLIDEVNGWLEDCPDEIDGESATLSGYDGEGWALGFLKDTFDLCDLFNIDIVEGDVPGSTYYAAELGMSIKEANAVAVKNRLPITFEPHHNNF